MSKDNSSMARRNENIDPSEKSSWEDLPLGSVVPAGNSKKYLTGRWVKGRICWDKEKCTKCNMCVPVCPDSCVLVGKDGKMNGIDEEHCKKCKLCVLACPFSALSFEDE